MTTSEFKQDHPGFSHLEGDDLWDAMSAFKLRQQQGDQILTKIKPFWQRYKLRYLFYRKTRNCVFHKHSSNRCVHCKKDSNVGLAMWSEDGTLTITHACGKPWIKEPNTNLDYRIWKAYSYVSNLFWRVLDFFHIVRQGSRYDMFGDESGYVKHWVINLSGKSRYDLRPRKWYEYIFIKK